jgi:hypothetical protein
MLEDLHVVDFHAHFPVRGEVSAAAGGVREYRSPEGGDPGVDALADRWLAELDRYGIDRIGFATGARGATAFALPPFPPHNRPTVVCAAHIRVYRATPSNCADSGIRRSTVSSCARATSLPKCQSIRRRGRARFR